MTIASAIAALSPAIWLKLDEGSGTTANNSGSSGKFGTISGTVDMTVDGPDQGTKGIRLFSGGQVVTQQMDLTTVVDMTLGLMVSTDASGTNGQLYPIVNVGDPSNRTARGPRLYEIHSTTGVPQYGGGWQVNGFNAPATAQPQKFWHWLVLTYVASTKAFLVWLDGTSGGGGTVGTVSNFVATDPLLIRCDEPVVVAHVCWWGGVILSSAQIQSVSNQIATWPYNVPVNTPPPAGGGGGLTSDQAQQLSDVHGWTSDIPGLVTATNFISSMVNTINGTVNQILSNVNAGFSNVATWTQNIMNGITATIGGVGATIQKTVGQLFSWVPTGDFGLYNPVGGPTCARIDFTAGGVAYYGALITITSYPSEWTFTTPDDDYSIRDLAVVNFYRGTTNIKRIGIHSKQEMIYPLPEESPFQIENFGVPNYPMPYRITVDWAGGVCGTLEMLYEP